MKQPGSEDKKRVQYTLNLLLASVAGQVGCLTLLIIFAALFAGLWLDRYLDSRPLFTVGLLIVSVPVTLIVMFRVVKSATDRIKPTQTNAGKPARPEDFDRD